MAALCIGLSLALGAMAAIPPPPAPVPEPGRAVQVKPGTGRPATQTARAALVIGNGAYHGSPLRNPGNDARAVTAALAGCGFQVQTMVDADLAQMEAALRQFGQRLKAGGVGLFYYSGHGMQVRGSNYLIPVGTDIEEEDEVRYKALDANEVLSKMESAGNGLNLMILDACRNDPFGHSWHRGGAQGLAQMDAPTGTYIAFATAPGRTASDGTGANGLYTQKFLEALKQPGLDVEQVFKRVRVGVKLASHDRQVPWDSSSLTGEFFFQGGPSAGESAPGAPPVRIETEAEIEQQLWDAIQDSTQPQDFQGYLSAYPSGRFAVLAQTRLRRLQAPPPAAAAARADLPAPDLKRQLVGSWVWKGDRQVFGDNGRGTYYRSGSVCFTFSYVVSGDLLTVTKDALGCGASLVDNFHISVTGSTMILNYVGNNFESKWTRS